MKTLRRALALARNIAVVAVFTSLSPLANAAEADPAAADRQKAASDSTAERPAEPASNVERQRPVADTEPRRRKPKDVFNPSEEISEDFAVSFPVDI